MYSDSNPRIKQLVDWFVAAGGWLHPDVSIVQDSSGSFHIIAANKIDSQDYALLARGHIRSTLSYLNLDHGQHFVPRVDSPLQRCLGKIPNHVLTYLFLVEQLNLKAESKWEHYIACLPRPETMNTPLWFSDEDAQYMQGTPLFNSITAQKELLREEWEAARIIMAECGLAEEAIYEQCDLRSYLWAVTIITSRAFISHAILPELPKFSLLFPVIDLLDHSPTAKAEWDFSVHDAFSLKISQPCQAGTELFNNYGPKTNGELLYGYGFAIENNPVEQIHLKIRFSDAAEEALSQCCGPDVLPFGMDPELCQPPYDNDVLIRPKYSPLGRYINNIPILSACPPQYVLSNYLAALHQRHLTPSSISNPTFPGARLTLATLKPFYALIQRRRANLPLTPPLPTPPQTPRQIHAATYRASQAKLTHNLSTELHAVLASVRVAHHAPNQGLITTTEALLALKHEHPTDHENLKTGLRAGWPDFDVDEDIGALVESGEEYLIWAVLLVVMRSVGMGSRTDRSGESAPSVISAWLQDLLSMHPPSLPTSSSSPDKDEGEDEDEDPDHAFLSAILQSAAALEVAPWTNIANLGSRECSATIAWALRVVRAELMQLPDLEREEWVRECLYVNTPGMGEEWILADPGVGDWREGAV